MRDDEVWWEGKCKEERKRAMPSLGVAHDYKERWWC